MRYLRNQLGMYIDPSRMELAVDLLLEARSLWIWSNRVGSERKDPKSLVRRSREDLRNATMFRAGGLCV